MEDKGDIYEEQNENTFDEEVDKFAEDNTIDAEDDEDECKEAKHDEVALKPKKTRRPQTEKQKKAFERCRKIRADKIAARKAEAEALKKEPVKKTKKKAKPPPPVLEEYSSEEEVEVVRRPKKVAIRKKKKKKVVFQDPTSSESSDEEVVAVVKKRKKPKKKAKPPPKVIYEDELDSTDEETVNHYIDVPQQPQLYIV